MSAISIEQQKSDKRTGLIVTILFHVLLTLLFLFIGLQQPNPLPREEMIELVMEDMGGGGGSIAAEAPGTPQPAPAPTPAVVQPEEVATEEESPVAVPKPVKPQPKPDPKPVQPAPPKPNPNTLFTPSTQPATPQDGPPGGSSPPSSIWRSATGCRSVGGSGWT
jgi:outer membrane biosynthesis protein TonB